MYIDKKINRAKRAQWTILFHQSSRYVNYTNWYPPHTQVLSNNVRSIDLEKDDRRGRGGREVGRGEREEKGESEKERTGIWRYKRVNKTSVSDDFESYELSSRVVSFKEPSNNFNISQNKVAFSLILYRVPAELGKAMKYEIQTRDAE